MSSRACRGCGASFTTTRPGAVMYCDACQQRRCGKCSRRGGRHHPTCPRRPAGRLCRRCGAPIFRASLAEHQAVPGVGGRSVSGDGRSLRHCLACRTRQCSTCQRYGGEHTAACPVGAGRGRVALPYRGVVSEQELLDLYEQVRARATRIAARICGLAAPDAVQDTAAYLWRRRDTLTAVSPGFFIMAVQQRASSYRRSWWGRHARALGPDGVAALQRRRARALALGGG